MSGPIVKPGVWPGTSGRNHANQVFRPQSCSGYSDKVANLERTIASVEQDFEEAVALAKRMGYLNNAILVTSVIKDSCVAFLDIGASILDTMGMKQAAKTASAGVAAIDIADNGSKWLHGQTSTAQAMTGIANASTNFMKSDTMMQAGTQYVVKKHTSAADVMSNAVNGKPSDQGELGMKYVADQVVSTADLIAKAGESSNQSWGAGLGKVMNGVKGLMAAQKYSSSLEKSFDSHIDESMYIQQKIQRDEANFRSKIKTLKQQLMSLKRELQGCINDTQQANGLDALFPDLQIQSTAANSTSMYGW
ncbi:hypothetical protein [uncultured Tateyamaria sp.]|uniref:hypothetical protein n=1 Tax=Tateyamaria sp. 1078 TaxID=3417464 RepID=UPI0026353128|nr:hypothetical protein [uncultured Tateyamaria sp.]